MEVAVTGGSGFIGTHVLELLRGRYNVTVFDTNESKLSDVKFFRIDINSLQDVIATLKNYDSVVHLAGVLGVEKSEKYPVTTLDTNVGGTRNVLEACRRSDIKKIIFASSSEVYGEPVKIPVEETDVPIPITIYGLSKLTAEEYVKSYSRQYGMKYTILRFFNAYGPGQATDFVIPMFVRMAIQNIPLAIHGDGSQVRAFCHVRDISQGILHALEGGDNETFNIGNDTEPITIKELAMRIISMTNSESKLSFLSFNRGRIKEIMRRIPSIEKAKRILGYKPHTSLNEGLTSVIAHLGDKK